MLSVSLRIGGERMKEEGTFDDWAEKMRIETHTNKLVNGKKQDYARQLQKLLDMNQVCPKCHWVNIPEIELHNNECISCAYPMKVVA